MADSPRATAHPVVGGEPARGGVVAETLERVGGQHAVHLNGGRSNGV
jgi:hypothetical protein